MSELVADCPRCGVLNTAFSLTKSTRIASSNSTETWEAFCVCQQCHKSTVFVVRAIISEMNLFRQVEGSAHGLESISGSINKYVNIEEYVNSGHFVKNKSPEYVPEKIKRVFDEGATCLAANCFNAACTMFRLCLELIVCEKLAETQNNAQNGSLAKRLGQVFEKQAIPEELRELSVCIKNDGNDAAHEGTLQKPDAEDLFEFTRELLKHIYTNPEKLKLANERRKQRRAENKSAK